jgi:pimeloyl-ACP methyl ester carboxylesterase
MTPKISTIKTDTTGREIEVWQKGAGPDLVFLHGAGGIAAWSPDLEALSTKYRVTVPLHPGYGRSTGIDEIDGVLDSVLHTFDVLDKLVIKRPILVGHSMGGMIAPIRPRMKTTWWSFMSDIRKASPPRVGCSGRFRIAG